ncbi:unnamed protein product [Allacma fusca]|uniref:CUB domain-containing protein n=1 Tax=Allacma fusca TaxID=39272 RepID=A0A8J2LK23_9HEXA|nr:unnamed protein product [Allacma fusca]
MLGKQSLLFLVSLGFLLSSSLSFENNIRPYLDDGDDIFDRDLSIERKLRSDKFDTNNPLGGRLARQMNVTQMNPGYGAVENGVGCGYQRMRPGQVVTIQSSNFRTGEYFNNEACVWRFYGHHCTLAAQCPCSDIPQSKHCLEDYLKISDGFVYLQRFCGDVRPTGRAMYVIPTNITCPVTEILGRSTPTTPLQNTTLGVVPPGGK